MADPDPAGRQKIIDEIETNRRDYRARVAEAKSLLPAYAAKFDALLADYEIAMKASRPIEEAVLAGDRMRAIAVSATVARGNAEYREKQRRLNDEIEQHLRTVSDELTAETGAAVWTTTGLVLAVLVGIIGLAIMVTQFGVAKPIRILSDAMERLALGDYGTVVTGADRQDEIGAMARSVQVFSPDLKRAWSGFLIVDGPANDDIMHAGTAAEAPARTGAAPSPR